MDKQGLYHSHGATSRPSDDSSGLTATAYWHDPIEGCAYCQLLMAFSLREFHGGEGEVVASATYERSRLLDDTNVDNPPHC
jgi:hypothetical protein